MDCSVKVFERFLQTKSRKSQLADSSPLAEGAETCKKDSRLALYKEDRNRCDIDGSSRMRQVALSCLAIRLLAYRHSFVLYF